jgi:Fe-S-cluster containining protein
VTPAGAPRVRALSIHADYRCRHAGVCCSSGWDIPVEPAAEENLRAALRAGRISVREPAFQPLSGLTHGARVVLAQDPAGRCVFLENDGDRRLCTVHRRLGEDALPSACRQFPRVVTLTPLGVSVTLSHYCPTAASLLFRPVIPRGPVLPGPEGSADAADPLLRLVEDPPAFPPSWPWEGLDARDALPPFLRPGVLMSWPSLERWERFAVSVLAEEGRTPEEALDVLADTAEAARRWTPDEGPFDPFFEALSSRGAPVASGAEGSAIPAPADPSGPVPWRDLGMTWRLVADCVPHRALLPAAPGGLEDVDRRWVAPAWPAFGRPIRFWLATKAFASRLVLQGEGLRTAVLGLRVALSVLRAEAARSCAEAGRALDTEVLREAIRGADLLLDHLADPEALARRLGRTESAG